MPPISSARRLQDADIPRRLAHALEGGVEIAGDRSNAARLVSDCAAASSADAFSWLRVPARPRKDSRTPPSESPKLPRLANTPPSTVRSRRKVSVCARSSDCSASRSRDTFLQGGVGLLEQ